MLCWLAPTLGLAVRLHAATPTVPPRCASPRAQSLAEAIDASLRHKYDPASISRVMGAWERMVRGEELNAPIGSGAKMERQQANSYIEGLGVRYFHDPLEEHDWARALVDGAPQVSEEFKRVALKGSTKLDADGNNVWASLAEVRGDEAASYGPEWRTLGLQDRGIWDPVNTKLFPKTTALLHSSGVPCVEAFFAKMGANSKIAAHSDGCNFHLTAHLGVDVPEGECWLQAPAVIAASADYDDDAAARRHDEVTRTLGAGGLGAARVGERRTAALRHLGAPRGGQ